ncbi:O-methyltransferase [Patescibacteria group bacterium]
MQKQVKNLLKSLEKTRHLYWNVSREVGEFLNILIKDRKFKKILEIGTSNGYSGIWMAEALQKNKGKLYTIESNQKSRFGLSQKNFKKSGLQKNIVNILGHAPENLPKIPQNFDMAFFDATKHEHLSYFEALKNRITKNGIIITDNAISHKKELKEYIKKVKSEKNWFSVILNIGTGLMISQKIL